MISSLIKQRYCSKRGKILLFNVGHQICKKTKIHLSFNFCTGFLFNLLRIQLRLLIVVQTAKSLIIKELIIMIPFRNKNVFTERPFFTHFASIPLIQPQHRTTIRNLQTRIRTAIHTRHPKYVDPQILKEHHHELCHLTLFKLTLRHSSARDKILKLMERQQTQIRAKLESMLIEIVNIKYFSRFNKNQKCNEITVIYGELSKKVEETVNQLIDKLMREMLKQEIVAPNQLKEMNVFYDHNENLYKPVTLHISLFRARNLLEDQLFVEIFKTLQTEFKQIQAQCHYFDISTMGKEYDQSHFYLPLHRIYLKPTKQAQTQLQTQKKEVLGQLQQILPKQE